VDFVDFVDYVDYGDDNINMNKRRDDSIFRDWEIDEKRYQKEWW
jgi:hypothetical protein